MFYAGEDISVNYNQKFNASSRTRHLTGEVKIS